MNILFIHPVTNTPPIQHYQLGIFSLMGVLKEQGHEVQYNPVRRIDFSDAEISDHWDILAIYTIDCNVDAIASFVDKNKDDYYIMLGGPCPTIAPEFVTANIYYDSMCLGEGEEAIIELLNDIKSTTVKSFWYNCGSIKNSIREQRIEKQIQEAPAPYRQPLIQGPMEEYCYEYKWLCTHIIAARGCPFSCTYCSNSGYNKILKHGVRMKSPEQLLEEERQTPISEDDILNANKKWFKAMMSVIKSNWKKRKISFEMNTRTNCITQEEIDLAIDAGCRAIRFGVESGNKHIRERMGRSTMTNEDILHLAKMVTSRGIDIYVCSIIGVPPETPEMFEETYDLINEINSIANANNVRTTTILNTFYPLHGTPLGDECYAKDIVGNHIQDIGSHVDYPLIVPTMSREYVISQQKRFREDFTGMTRMEEKYYA